MVLGQADFDGALANRGADAPRADTLFWCYGVAIAGGRLFVADTGNRRVLVWDRIPTTNGAAADLVLGQRDFTTRDENAGGEARGLGMRWPHGIAVADGSVLVSDAGNNRIMVWRDLPAMPGRPCSFVLGQTDLDGLDHNRAAYYPTAAAMSMPYGIAVQGERLVVADTANSRLLAFDVRASRHGRAGDRRRRTAGLQRQGRQSLGRPARDSLCWPYNVAACGATLVVADSGNNRVLLWEAAP